MENLKFKIVGVIISFLLCYANTSLAQQVSTTEEGDFENDMEHILENLSTHEITSDFFYNKTFPFIPLEPFDGSTHSPIININHFGQMVATLYGAAMTDNVKPNPGKYMNAIQASTHSVSKPLTFMLYNYQRFKEDAIEDNLIDSINGQLFDVPNRPESPYEEKTVFAATSVHSTIYNLSPSFMIPDSLLYSNMEDEIYGYEIDLDDGNGFQTLTLNTTIHPTYSANGEKELTLKCLLNSGDILYANFTIIVDGEPLTEDYSEEPDDTLEIPEVEGEHDGGNMYVFYNCPEQGLVKPFVIIDGFDPPQREKNRSWDNMIERLSVGAYEIDGTPLIDYLEDEGYDLIFLDHNYGSDDLRRNAEMVEDGIDILNISKTESGSSEPNVIAGASMGAVIGKYALLEMETQGDDHDTKIFISLDGPMLGANIPLGFQSALYHFANIEVLGNKLTDFVPALESGIAILEEAASKQFLYYHAMNAQDIDGDDVTDEDLISQEHVDFYSELEQFDEPQHFEYIAISSGSVTSSPGQLFNAGEQLVDVDLSIGGLPLIGQPLIGLPPLYLYPDIDIDIYALPDHPNGQFTIYHGDLRLKTLFGITLIKSKKKVIIEGDIQPYDSAPGGLIGFDPDDPDLPSSLFSLVDVPYSAWCFVPTVSSLDIKSPENEDLFLDLTDPNIVTSQWSTLVRYDASTDASITSFGDAQENQFHAELNISNIPYLLHEIGSYNGLLGISVISNRTYNFGKSSVPLDNDNPTAISNTSNRINQSMVITNNGKLWINRDDKIGFTDEDNPLNTIESDFTVIIRKKCQILNPIVKVKNGGEIQIGEWEVIPRNKGTLVVDEGAILKIENNGKIELDQQSKLIVAKGGILEIESGGRLKLLKGAQVIVEEGGQLVINSGANIDLWWNDFGYEGTTIEGSNIHIKSGGELIYNGEPNLTGSGFFQFDQGNILSLNAPFVLSGQGKTKRLIRLNPYAILDIGSHSVEFDQMKIEYMPSSQLRVGENGQGKFQTMTFEGTSAEDNAVGISGQESNLLRAWNCELKNLDTGIEGNEMYDVSDEFNVLLCKFTQCQVGIFGGYCKEIDISSSSFIPYDDASNATWFWNVEKINFNGVVTGYGELGGILLSNDLSSNNYGLVENTLLKINGGRINGNHTGIKMLDLSRVDIITSNTQINNNIIGIDASGIFANESVFANVTLNKKSELIGNETGVLMGKGQTYTASNGLMKDYGVFEMSCSKMLDNIIGLEGTDIYLNIDACLVSGQPVQNCDYSQTYASHFRVQPAGTYFKICYVDRQGMDIDATGNYWESGLPQSAFDYSIGSIDNFGGSWGCLGLMLNTSNPATHIAESCGFVFVDVPGKGESSNNLDENNGKGRMKTSQSSNNIHTCFYTDEWNDEVSLSEWFNYSNYLMFNEEEDLAARSFEILARINDEAKNTYDESCQHYINIAKSRTFYHPSIVKTDPSEFDNRHNFESLLGDDWNIEIYPNPATNEVQIKSIIESGNIQIRDVQGKIIVQDQINEQIRLNVSNWSSGIYFVQLKNNHTEKIFYRKLIIE